MSASLPPGAAYLERLLGSDGFIALVALKGGEVGGGIAAYELRKFEREGSEVYLYDLAVAALDAPVREVRTLPYVRADPVARSAVPASRGGGAAEEVEAD